MLDRLCEGSSQVNQHIDNWHSSAMAWEWVGPVVTGVVALGGVSATVVTAAQGRGHAERLATQNHDRLRQEALRQDRVSLYGDALAHALDIERSLDAIWISVGAEPVDLTPRPAGGPMPLAPMDAITVRMRLIADVPVEEAWAILVDAWEHWQWWSAHDWSGDPDEAPPARIVEPLRVGIGELTRACKSAMSESSGS